MRFCCDQNDLAQAITTLSLTVPKKSSLPILGCVKITVSKGEIKFTATDLESSVQLIIPGAIKEPGEALINLNDLKPYINKYTGNAEIFTENEKIRIKAGCFDVTLNPYPLEEFPLISPLETFDPWFDVPLKAFQDNLKKVSFIPLKDDPRPFLSGIHFEITTGLVRLVATDVNRLGVAEMPAKIYQQNEVLIYNAQILRLAKIKTGKNLEAFSNDKIALFKADNIEYQFRLVDSQYPKWPQVIPESMDLVGGFEANRKMLLQAFKQISAASHDINITVTDKMHLALPTDAGQIGGITLDIIPFGPAYSANFNIRFILELLQAVTSETVKFVYQEKPNKPAQILLGDDTNYIYIVMPLNPKKE